jgi:hypothetical protein
MSVSSSDDLARIRVLFEHLRARWREVEKGSPLSPPAFVPLPPTDFRASASAVPITTGEARIHLVWERTDGSRLHLSLPASQWTQAEALCTAFFRS